MLDHNETSKAPSATFVFKPIAPEEETHIVHLPVRLLMFQSDLE